MSHDDLKKLMPIREIAKQIPSRRAGRPVHFSCLNRWMNHGCRGVLLSYVQVGCTRMLSMEMLDEFFESVKLNSQNNASRTTLPHPKKLPASRRREIAAAKKSLKGRGV